MNLTFNILPKWNIIDITKNKRSMPKTAAQPVIYSQIYHKNDHPTVALAFAAHNQTTANLKNLDFIFLKSLEINLEQTITITRRAKNEEKKNITDFIKSGRKKTQTQIVFKTHKKKKISTTTMDISLISIRTWPSEMRC